MAIRLRKCEFCGILAPKRYHAVFREEENVHVPMKVCEDCLPEEFADDPIEVKEDH